MRRRLADLELVGPATHRWYDRRMRDLSMRGFVAATVLAVTYTAELRAEEKKSENRETPFSAEDRAYWAFQPLRRPAPPIVKHRDRGRNPIDALILARLEAAGLEPAPEADRRTLLRRACFDLHGLPPTPEEVAAFESDPRPDAYERLIDRLLASPRYGERWARHWLDLVRYAETDGYNQDAERPHAWRYRDYVVRSLNEDKPYDRFLAEQVAGDELFPDDFQALVATGFLRHWPYEYNQRDVPQQRMHILNDLTDVAGHVFLGLTIRCARCHDHKFDAITQRDYFRLQAFFAPLMAHERAAPPLPEHREAHERQQRAWETATAGIRKSIADLEAKYLLPELRRRREAFPKETQAVFDKPDAQCSPYEKQIAALARRQFALTAAEINPLIKGDDGKRWDALRQQLAKFDHLRSKQSPGLMSASDVGPIAPPTFVPGEGSLDDASTHIAPGFLSVLDPSPAQAQPTATSTGRRTALARWLTSPQNPLVARVMVNRLWHHHFRRGLVATPNDLGRQGEKCTHLELLDWLASEFIASGWSLKHVHRLMMTAATYRQASLVSPSRRAAAVDLDNKLLWRMHSGRLEAEAVRDTILAVSGELNHRMEGPSVYPELPSGISVRHAWPATKSAAERNRRSIYLFVKRNLLHPLLDSFDMPDPHESCARRQITTTAPQALILLNGDWSLDRAVAFANRLQAWQGDRRDMIRQAYRIAYGRPPSNEEIAVGLDFLETQASLVSRRPAAALVDFCHALLNSNELIWVD
jgi:hypothetical protein